MHFNSHVAHTTSLLTRKLQLGLAKVDISLVIAAALTLPDVYKQCTPPLGLVYVFWLRIIQFRMLWHAAATASVEIKPPQNRKCRPSRSPLLAEVAKSPVTPGGAA
jgi:hypothetical protein